MNYFLKKIIILSLISLSGLCYLSCSESLEKVIGKEVEAVNKKCPIAYEANIRLDSLFQPDKSTIAYSYTLLNVEKSLMNIDSGLLENNLKEGIKASKDIEKLREMNANFSYNYYDKNGDLCFTFLIKPDQYK